MIIFGRCLIMKFKKKPGLLLNSSYSLIGSVTSIILSLGSSITVARFLAPEEKGIYDLLLTVIALLATIVGLSLPSGIVYVVAKEKININFLIKILAALISIQGFVAISIVYLSSQISFLKWMIPIKFVNIRTIFVIGILVCITLLNGYLNAILIGKQKILQSNKIDVLGKILFLILLWVAIFFSYQLHKKPDYLYVAFIYLLSLIATFIFLLTTLISESISIIDSKRVLFRYCSQILSFSLVAYVGNLIQFLNYKIDIFFVAKFTDNLENVGFYTLAVSLAQLTWLIPSSVSSVIFPLISSEVNTNKERVKKIIYQSTKTITFLNVIVVLLMALLIPIMLPFVYGLSFTPAIMPFFYLLPGVILLGTSKILANYIAAINKPHINTLIALITFIITLVFNYVLVPKFGIVGAAITSSLSYTATFVLTTYYLITLNNDLSLSLADLFLFKVDEFSLIITAIREFFSSYKGSK